MSLSLNNTLCLYIFQNYINDFALINKEIELQDGDKGCFLGLYYKPIYSVSVNFFKTFFEIYLILLYMPGQI